MAPMVPEIARESRFSASLSADLPETTMDYEFVRPRRRNGVPSKNRTSGTDGLERIELHGEVEVRDRPVFPSLAV